MEENSGKRYHHEMNLYLAEIGIHLKKGMIVPLTHSPSELEELAAIEE
jgi:hypothetical protein